MLLDNLSQLLIPTGSIGLVTTLIVILVARYIRSPWRKVPPGPKGLPILGHALRLSDKSWMFEKDVKRKFGVCKSIFPLSDRKLTKRNSQNT